MLKISESTIREFVINLLKQKGIEGVTIETIFEDETLHISLKDKRINQELCYEMCDGLRMLKELSGIVGIVTSKEIPNGYVISIDTC